MTHEEKYKAVEQAIRGVCSETTIEASGDCGRLIDGKLYQYYPLRLSHVLRAVLEENQKRLLKGNGEWFVNSTELQGGICGAWALAHDDLSKQSPETISFLHSILCPSVDHAEKK